MWFCFKSSVYILLFLHEKGIFIKDGKKKNLNIFWSCTGMVAIGRSFSRNIPSNLNHSALRLGKIQNCILLTLKSISTALQKSNYQVLFGLICCIHWVSSPVMSSIVSLHHNSQSHFLTMLPKYSSPISLPYGEPTLSDAVIMYFHWLFNCQNTLPDSVTQIRLPPPLSDAVFSLPV